MASPNPSELQELAANINWARLVNYCTFASGTIATLEWFLTLDLEVSLVWQSNWSMFKGLYLLARYLPFMDVTLALFHQFSQALSPDQCQRLYEAQIWIYVSGATLVELIFTLRTWAVWGAGKRFSVALAMTFITTWTGAFVAQGFYSKNITHGRSPAPGFIGCFITETSTFISIGFALLMSYDAFLLSLMATRGLPVLFQSGETVSRLLRVILGDGIIYFFYVFVIALVNLIVFNKLPVELQLLLVLAARVIHAVLACRVVLHIREQAALQRRGGLEDSLVHPGSIHGCVSDPVED